MKCGIWISIANQEELLWVFDKDVMYGEEKIAWWQIREA